MEPDFMKVAREKCLDIRETKINLENLPSYQETPVSLAAAANVGMAFEKVILEHPDSVSEEDWQQFLMCFVREIIKGKAVHFRKSRTAKGWRTAVEGDGIGYPDCMFVVGRIVYAELKSENGIVAFEQQKWIDCINECGGEAYIWRPNDWMEAKSVLSKQYRDSQ